MEIRVLCGSICLLLSLCVIGADTTASADAAEQQRPNVLFIMVDDLGWSDVGFNESKVYETPNVDRLSQQGMTLTDFYSGGPVCSPTRASIMTGKYTARTGITTYLLSPTRDAKHVTSQLALEEFTIAEAFKKNGYATGYFGKWHLGYESQYWAANQGFDVAKGGIDLPWAWTLCYPDIKQALTTKTWPKSHTRFFSPYHLTHLKNGAPGEYLTDRLTNETISFIEKNRDKPFFAFLSFHSVHTPLQAKPEKIGKYRNKIVALGLDKKKEKNRSEKAFQNNAAYAAMVEHMDENVGRLLRRLDELKLSDNTIVVWTSDNGGKGSVTSNLPLRGMKHNLYEGGIRVPTVVRWPGKIAAGRRSSIPLISNDFYPTLLEATGCSAEPQQHVDAVSFKDVLLGKNDKVDRDTIYWHYPHGRQEAAVREGQYKLLHRFKEGRVELYDLQADIGEKHDLSKEMPKLASRLLDKLKAWQASVGAKFEAEKREEKSTVRRRTPNLQPKNRAALLTTKTLNRPNVLLIVSEDNGAELGCYGTPDVRTPYLDRLASEGCRFANAYVPHAVCSASRAAFLTGLYPFQNGQIGLATHHYSMFQNWDNLPSVLKVRGYRTGLIGKLHVNPESAFPFDFRWNESKANSFGSRNVERVAEAAGQFFRDTQQPFFLSLNFADAHFPVLRQQNGLPKHPLKGEDVSAPLPFIGADSPRLRQGTADYYNCMMRLDSGIGMVLDQLKQSGKADETLVIYIGDHGAQFSRGKATCYEGGLRIPMIVRWPGQVKPKTVCHELVSTIDILPTVIQATAIPSRASLPGRSLLSLAADRDVPWRKYLFAERTAYDSGSFYPQRTLRDQRYKVIVNLSSDQPNPVADTYRHQAGSFFVYGTNQEEISAAPKHVQMAYATWRNPPPIELYDLKEDPWEFRNLADNPELAGVKRRLLSELKRFRERHNDPLLDSGRLKLLAAEHKHVATKIAGGRYGRGQNWQYLTYLQASGDGNTTSADKQDGLSFSSVFARGQDGYPDYRIPSLVTTRSGTLLAFSEGRQSLSDHARNDIVLKRSTNGGRSWGTLIRVHQDKDSVLVNPCAVVLDSGRVLMMYQRFPHGYHARAIGKSVKLLKPGLTGDAVCTTLVTWSDDDGKTWSQPLDVTVGTKRVPKVISTAAGPGQGIVLTRGKHKGRIVMPTNEGWWEGRQRFFNVYACYSDDHGQSWRYGKPAPKDKHSAGNEVQMVELSDGSVMLNSRSYNGAGFRKTAISTDGGQTWSPLVDEDDHPEPGCMGTILRYSFGQGRENRMLFANPNSNRGRENGTVRLSFDDGKTWPIEKVITTGSYAYSCLTKLSDGSVGLLFETDGYRQIRFVRFKLDWLTSVAD